MQLVSAQAIHVELNCRLFSLVKPVIEPFVLPNSVQMGQRLSITCTVAKGDPPLIIKWLHDGEIINEDSHHNNHNSNYPASNQQFVKVFHLTEYSSTLLFEAVKQEHRGNYTCLASNDVGEDSHGVSMVIYGELSSLVTRK